MSVCMGMAWHGPWQHGPLDDTPVRTRAADRIG